MEDQVVTESAPEVIETETVEQAENAESPTAAAPETQPEPPKPDAVQKRIDRLTREKYRAKAEAEQLRRQLEQVSQQRPQQQEKGVPQREHFADDFSFFKAVARHEAAQELAERQARMQMEQEERQAQRQKVETVTAFDSRLEKVRDAIPDYDEIIQSADVQISQAMYDVILESDKGPEVTLYFARNPEEAEKLSQLSPTAAARAIGRIEEKLEREALAKKQSTAPKPVKPVGGSVPASNTPADNEPIDMWMRKRNAQVRGSKS